MKCENCGEREAVVHVTKIINNEKHEYNLCKTCAHSMNTFKAVSYTHLDVYKRQEIFLSIHL